MAGAFDDDLDRLLAFIAANVALGGSLEDGTGAGFEGKVVRVHDVQTRHAVVVDLHRSS